MGGGYSAYAWMVPKPAGTVSVALALPEASVGVLCAVMAGPPVATRTVNVVPCGMLVVVRFAVIGSGPLGSH